MSSLVLASARDQLIVCDLSAVDSGVRQDSVGGGSLSLTVISWMSPAAERFSSRIMAPACS
jgi:hypothetical protein